MKLPLGRRPALALLAVAVLALALAVACSGPSLPVGPPAPQDVALRQSDLPAGLKPCPAPSIPTQAAGLSVYEVMAAESAPLRLKSFQASVTWP